MDDCFSSFVLANGEIKQKDANFSENINVENLIYEIFRVYKGVPAFLDDHLSRIVKSAQLLSISLPYSTDTLKAWTKKFVEKAQIYEGNIKIIFSRVDANPVLLIYQIAHKYPTSTMYENGVACDFLYEERENPNAKHFLPVRQIANEYIRKNALHEVLLVNKHNEVTEGSRTNVFFVKERIAYTSESKNVLEGITRKNVIQLLLQMNVPVKEMSVSVDFALSADAVFLTGTSPKILPVHKIGNTVFDVHEEIMRSLMSELDLFIDKRVSKFHY